MEHLLKATNKAFHNCVQLQLVRGSCTGGIRYQSLITIAMQHADDVHHTDCVAGINYRCPYFCKCSQRTWQQWSQVLSMRSIFYWLTVADRAEKNFLPWLVSPWDVTIKQPRPLITSIKYTLMCMRSVWAFTRDSFYSWSTYKSIKLQCCHSYSVPCILLWPATILPLVYIA